MTEEMAEPLPQPETTSMSLTRTTWFQTSMLIIVGALAYANSFNVPFLFDDETSIVNNTVLRDLYGFLRDGYSYNPNRFIGYLSFAGNYALGGLTVSGYHAVNLTIHLANALLVYALVRLVLVTPLVNAGPRVTRSHDDTSGEFWFASLMPFLVALLFVCHPLQTQAVTYIVQRLTSLSTLFYLTSLVLYLQWRLAYESGAPALSFRVGLALLLSVAAAVLAMKTKEIAATLPFMALLSEFALFGKPDRKRLALLAPLLVTVLVVPLTMLNLHQPAGDILSDVSVVTADTTALNRGSYLITQFGVILTYLRLMVFPLGQNLDHDIPISYSLFEFRPLVSLFVLLCILAGAGDLWRRSASGSRSAVTGFARMGAFGIFWFFIALSVESSIVPIRDVLFEHRVYLPSVGFCMAVVALVGLVAGRIGRKLLSGWQFAAAVLVVVALIFAGTTFARNRVWRDGVTLWSDVRDKSPRKYRAYSMLGTYYADEGRTSEALTALETAVQLNPKAYDSLFNLAQVYGWQGRNQEAERILATLKREAPERYREFEAVYRSQFSVPGATR